MDLGSLNTHLSTNLKMYLLAGKSLNFYSVDWSMFREPESTSKMSSSVIGLHENMIFDDDLRESRDILY